MQIYARYILIGIFFVSVILNVIQYRNFLNIEKQVPYATDDQSIIQQSEDLYVDEINETLDMDRQSILNNRFPVVTESESERCVNLRAPRGSIGYTPFFCFDRQDRLISRGRI